MLSFTKNFVGIKALVNHFVSYVINDSFKSNFGKIKDNLPTFMMFYTTKVLYYKVKPRLFKHHPNTELTALLEY